ncbi:MAG: hypothetical protein PWP58_1085 [Bacillota bacterium]|nr:hypothetical protein [Bacillota bacterium]
MGGGRAGKGSEGRKNLCMGRQGLTVSVTGIGKRGKSVRKGISIIAVLALLVSLLPAVPAMAAPVTGVSAAATDNKAGATATYDVSFTAPSGLGGGDEITVTFATGYTLGAINEKNTTITYQEEAYTPSYVSVSGTAVKIGVPAELTVGQNGEVKVSIPNVTNPQKAGNYSIAVRTTIDSAASTNFSIVAADPAKLAIDGLAAQVTAGSSQDITVELTDKYGNEANATSAVTVKLSDTAGFEGSGTINGSSSTTISWNAPQKVGTYTLTAEDVTEGATTKMQAASVAVEVVAAEPTTADISGPGYLDVDQEGSYTITLKDEYGNIAKAPSDLTLNLSPSPADSATFDPNPVTVKANESSATFKFKSSEAGIYTITAKDSASKEFGTKTVAVGVTVLNKLAVTAPTNGEVGIASEITIELKDQFDKPFAAPDDLTISLSTDKVGNGTFYDKPSNGTSISSVTVPKGQSSVKVYYVPGTNAVGAHKLTFEVDQVLSDGTSTGDKVRAEATINVGTGAELGLVVSLPTFTAGQRGEATITVRDGHGNDVAAGPNGRVVYLETQSPTGKFYAAAEGGDPITQVTIPAGQASVKVYYVDTESWTKKAMAAGELSATGLSAADYSYTVAFRSEGVIGFSGKAIVNPFEAKAITLDVAQQSVDAMSDEELTQIGSNIGATDLIGVAYMRVGVVDQYGNPVPQQALLRISMKDDSPSAFLWDDYAEIENGEWAEEYDAWLAVTAPGTYKVTATAGGLTGAEKQVTFEQPSLVIEAPATALPDARVPVTVKLTNLWASGRDLTVDLGTSTPNSAFYATDQTAEAISQAVIPAYDSEVTVYLESDDPLGTAVELTASIADLSLMAKATVTLGRGPDAVAKLGRGWNIVSTPWILENGKNAIDKILAHPEYVEQAWGYKDGQWYQVTSADPASMGLRPLEALYVKLKGATDAVFCAKPGLGTPPVRDLAAGWNLVGNPADEDNKPVNEALSSISGSYAVVISPAGCNQGYGWVYTPQTTTSPPKVEKFRGYWVYMTKADKLAGQAMPPLE